MNAGVGGTSTDRQSAILLQRPSDFVILPPEDATTGLDCPVAEYHRRSTLRVKLNNVCYAKHTGKVSKVNALTPASDQPRIEIIRDECPVTPMVALAEQYEIL